MISEENEALLFILISNWKKDNGFSQDKNVIEPMDGDDVEEFLEDVKFFANYMEANINYIEYKHRCTGDCKTCHLYLKKIVEECPVDNQRKVI